ncbi:MAG TPA: glycosyl transferase [Cyanobacteria bacterium UBA11162]|nr:glycosyl transferase [Cyanobacteria bacterium UBA11162]
MSIDFTVAIPTYNGASRLPKVLDKLRCQVDTEQISWEVIVIDNNSTDETAKVVEEYQGNWTQLVPLNYFLESEQGAAFARLRAVREAKGELVGFLDDDNLPNPDWVAQAYLFAQKYPQAGAFSGQIHGEFEVKPPENFERIQAFLAIREHGTTPHRFEAENLRLPTAAALVVRKKAWNGSVPNRPMLKGRLGKSMLGGEDYEPLLYIHKAGWEIWYNPELHSYHQIPSWRLERDYLLSISRGCGLATCQLRMINAKSWEKPITFARTLLGNLRRIISHFIKYRGQVQTNLIAACEMEFFFGSFLSLFFYLKMINNLNK